MGFGKCSHKQLVKLGQIVLVITLFCLQKSPHFAQQPGYAGNLTTQPVHSFHYFCCCPCKVTMVGFDFSG